MDLLEVTFYYPAGEPDGQRPSSKQISNVMIDLSTKVPWIIEIKSYKTCEAKWDNIAIPFSC